MNISRRALLISAAPILLSSPPASAHHGWSSFDTRYAYFAAGEVTYVRWGNPHSEVRLRVQRTALPDNWASRPMPPGADETNGRATMVSARPYRGEHKELRLVLAGPEWMARWGLNRPLRVGEAIEAVGFLGSAEAVELRPMIFWLGDGQGVWQQLTGLPRPPEPAR
jgi:hypothetical protein